MKILAIGDTANVITDLKKYTKTVEIELINFKEGHEFLIKDEETEFFNEYNLFQHLKKINSIKNQYDIVLVMGWTAAKLAYLAGLDYIIYFVGNDIRNPPFEILEESELSLTPKVKFNLIEKKFYKSVLNNALACITVGPELFGILKKYRKDAYRIDQILFDKSLFQSSIPLKNKSKTKFTFFSPQRISFQKGFDILWEAISLCKSDFEILQVEWFDYELENKKAEIIAKKPKQIKLIPQIPRNEMIKYYNYCDAVIGNLRFGYIEGVGREGAMCKKPVLNYINSKYRWILDEREVIPPFLPQSNDPNEISTTIDKIVQSKEFRQELIDRQYSFVNKLTNPEKTIELWENLIEHIFNKNLVSNNKSSMSLFFRLVYFLTGRGTRKITNFIKNINSIC